ncbi:uncharacterized protein MONBRDRAFT_12799 [Monosiga brevicollis MX1]|uniref:Rab-GAP TBC domain-containing protein n=1 Tax=Monosiga brevicollis TaxID=81824 RepID=A9VDC4_MONBE|nr:uncharacterized protein MONBRDRAFT_12799 [Monosiga brevicollis MX1]EDQ84421.1 predicted protein [Monosiga brevicollis MX1]|eukprot:XP_001750716.1 hypothetical protein [Monosiga brevicollis MX1]
MDHAWLEKAALLKDFEALVTKASNMSHSKSHHFAPFATVLIVGAPAKQISTVTSQCDGAEAQSSTETSDAGIATIHLIGYMELSDGRVVQDKEPIGRLEFAFMRGLQLFLQTLASCPHVFFDITGPLQDVIPPRSRRDSSEIQSEAADKYSQALQLKRLRQQTRFPNFSALDEETFRAFKSDEGRLEDLEALRKVVFFKGIRPAFRREVWLILLGVVNVGIEDGQRSEALRQLHREYYELKQSWVRLPSSDTRLNRILQTIIKDAQRTDRHFPMFARRDSEWLNALLDILATFVNHHNVDYVQGMSDILAPLVAVFQDEAVAYFAFDRLIKRFSATFEDQGVGIHLRLDALRSLTELLLPDVFNFLCQRDQMQMFFAYRWLLLDFKREFSLEETCELWETIWCDYRSDCFNLFIATAIMAENEAFILDESRPEHELLEMLTSLPTRVDVQAVLRRARQLLYRSLELPLPKDLAELIKVALADGAVVVNERSAETPTELPDRESATVTPSPDSPTAPQSSSDAIIAVDGTDQ